MKKHLSHYLIIVGVCLLAFYQIAFLLESLKWDNIDSYLPMRFFVSECMRNGIFPLWLPYQGLGCPIFGDLISTNYPLPVMLGRLVLYDNVVLHMVFIGYILLAGFGMYRLATELKIKHEIALILAIAYTLSGFFTGNAQHLQFIISGAWIPYIIRYYIQLCNERKSSVWLKFVLVTYLQASGGYPAHTLFLAYLLVAFFIIRVIQNIALKKHREVLALIKVNFFALVVLGVMCFGIFLSINQSSPYIDRYNGMSYEMSAYNPFAPECLISLISPLTPASFPKLFNTDLSMNNLYIGIIVLVFFIYGITRPLSRASILFLIAGTAALLIAFGPYFFLHRLAWEYLPLFKTFRHPSNLRLFTILFFLLFTGIQITHYDITEKKNRLWFKRVLWIFMGLLLLSGLFSAFRVVGKSADAAGTVLSFSSLTRNHGIYGPLLIQLTLAFIFTGLVYLSVFIQKKIPFYGGILFLVIAEMVIFTQMNAAATVYYTNSDPIALRKHLRNRPHGFPLPDHHTVAENTESSIAYRQFVENSNTYAKSVSVEKCYPFVPDGFRILTADTPLCLASCNNRLIYMAEKILPAGKRDTYRTDPSLDNKTVFVPDTLYNQRGDCYTSPYLTGDTVIISCLNPSLIEAEIQSAHPRIVVLLQNDFHGWNVFVDDTAADHFTVNHSLIGVTVPPGNHRLRYEFKNPVYVKATFSSFSLFLVLVYVAVVLSLREQWKVRRNKMLAWIIPAVPLMLLVFFLLKPRMAYAEQQKNINRIVVQVLDSALSRLKGESTFMILNTESSHPFTEVNTSDGFIFQRFRLPSDIIKIWDVIDTLCVDKVIYAWSNVLEIPEIQDIISLYYPVLSEKHEGDRYAVSVYSKRSGEKPISEFYSMNDFENPVTGWSFDKSSLDSSIVYSGRYAEKLTFSREFSSTFRHVVDHIPVDRTGIFSALKFYRGDHQSCVLVINVLRNGKTLHYHTAALDTISNDEKGWNKVFLSQHYAESDLKKDDEILVYCWNLGKNKTLYIDDFVVRIEGK
ncbi:MAG: hypothetical protein JW973_10505 [Bacteroidales bacterium]|nr:hypothetical protein [Bacteroidales bacterium]